MIAPVLHATQEAQHVQLAEVNGQQVVHHYGDPLAEYAALRESAGILDLSFRSRLCLRGADRQRFLHGQVTNDVKGLDPGEGCYAALVTAKGKMLSDLNIYCLPNEFLLDFEPGLGDRVATRLRQYIIADDVTVVDMLQLFGLLSVQGPRSAVVIDGLGLGIPLPTRLMSFVSVNVPAFGEAYCVNQPRGHAPGFDLFVPTPAIRVVADKLNTAAKSVGGCLCGWQALETVRLEADIPRFGIDMDETNLPPEAGIEGRAISYSKGCYIGQEVIARVRTYGQVAKALRGLRLADKLKPLPNKGDKLFFDGQEAGYVTSAFTSPTTKVNFALGYVRREHNQPGTELQLRSASGESRVRIVPLPFVPLPPG